MIFVTKLNGQSYLLNNRLIESAEEKPDTTLPVHEREIGGLGIHMIRKCTTRVIYSNNNNEQNRLTMTFHLSDDLKEK